jgi:phospholipid/cholesterol/gamma-HCH transport system substrate-binding protein
VTEGTEGRRLEPGEGEEEGRSRTARIATIAALGVAAIGIYTVLFGGDQYKVTAQFENASQLVEGNQVAVAGLRAGSVASIELGPRDTAVVELEIDDEYAPLHEGTIATIRQESLSGIANRYVALQLPADGKGGAEIPDGGELGLGQTVSEVDLDQLFNTLDEPTIGHFKQVVRGFARAYDGTGKATNATFKYLNPFLSSSRRVFSELTADTEAFERLLVDSASLSGALAARSPDLSALVGNLDRMMRALGSENRALASSVGQLPGFMRNANTTFVNTRATLDDLDPLVAASKPVARKLQPFARDLRIFARDAVPAIRDLDGIVRRKGNANDLVELVRLQRPLSKIAVGPVSRNGAQRAGALPIAREVLDDSLPLLSFLRPYVTTEGISGWFNTFGNSGGHDANGTYARFGITLSPFSISLPNVLKPLFPDQLLKALGARNLERCPGANERPASDGSTPFTDNGQLDCDPSQLPSGR